MAEDRVLACPNCGNEHVGSNDSVAAIARGQWVEEPDGDRIFLPGGYTDMCWDSQTADAEKPAYCQVCASEWSLDQLVLPLDPELLKPDEALAMVEDALAHGFDGDTPDDVGNALKSLRAHLEIKAAH